MKVDKEAIKTVAKNKKAYHEFHILETMEAGLVLQGTEVKSIRAGLANLSDAYARVDDGKLVLHGMEISPYSHGNYMNHEPKRPRTLLMHRREILRLMVKTHQKGLTLIPVALYFKRGLAKIELGLAQGKKLYDKREDLKKKDVRRDLARAMERKYR